MTPRRSVCCLLLLAAVLLLVPAAPAAARKNKKPKPGELPAEICNREDVKLGPRNLFFEVAFEDVKVNQRVRDKGSFCFEREGVSYEVTPSLSKDRIGFVDVEVRRVALSGEQRIDVQFHVHEEQFLDTAAGWPEHLRLKIENIRPPLNRTMVGPRTEAGGSVIRQ